VCFGELRQVKRISESLREFFEPRRAAGRFVFSGGRSGGFDHSSILSNSPPPKRTIREIPAGYSIVPVPRIPLAPDRFGRIADGLELMVWQAAYEKCKIEERTFPATFARFGSKSTYF
jgi:hypothetical protein